MRLFGLNLLLIIHISELQGLFVFFRDVINGLDGRLGRLIIAVVHVIIPREIEVTRISSTNFISVLNICMKMEIAVFMSLLTYYTFKDGALSSKHICDYLFRGGALGPCKEKSFRINLEWHGRMGGFRVVILIIGYA